MELGRLTDHEREQRVARWALASSLVGLVTFVPALVGVTLGTTLLLLRGRRTRRVALMAWAAVATGVAGAGGFAGLAGWRLSNPLPSYGTSLRSGSPAPPPAVRDVLEGIFVAQREYHQTYSGWATTFATLGYRPPADAPFAVCLPADCIHPQGAPARVPRTLWAHLAVGDCLAAVVPPDHGSTIWVVYDNGSIDTGGRCLAD